MTTTTNPTTSESAILGPIKFTEQHLTTDEKILYATKMHPIAYTPVIITALFGLLFLISGDSTIIGIGIMIILFAGLGAGLTFLNIKNSEYVLTSKKVVIKTGIINKTSLEILLSKIEGLDLNQGILGSSFNFGSIAVRGTGASNRPIKDITNPTEFRKKVNEQIETITKTTKN